MAHNSHDWLSLVELSGLLISEPVLNESFESGAQPLDFSLARQFRTEFERWRGATDRQDAEALRSARSRWITFILRDLLAYDRALRGRIELPPQLRIQLTDYLQTLQPDYFVVGAEGVPELLVLVTEGELDRPEQVTGRWKASPFTKMDRLLRETRIPLGILTNGDDWRLIYAAPGLPTSYLTWTADGWNDERSTLNAFAMLLRSPARLLAMASESQQRQADVTDQLGNQVLSALSIFVRELDRADLENGGKLLAEVTPEQVYEMALFVMMRLVFMFYAEENGLLPHGDVFYDQAYGLTHLWNRLERERAEDTDRYELREDAYPGLLASFRMIYHGCTHADFRMVAYGGALFDPERFPVLEDARLRIRNSALGRILRHLTTAESKDGRQRVSYRALQVEQLGYVYENLLGYTVRAAKELMILPSGGLEAQPLAAYAAALETETLYETFKSHTRMHWAQAKARAADAVMRFASSGDAVHALDPLADDFIQPGQRYIAFQMGTRKRGGIFYTPPQLTSFLVEQALKPQCYDDADGDAPRIRSPKHILSLTVCDPAMGSGAFLVQAVRYLADRLLEAWDAAAITATGDTKLVMPFAEPERTATENEGVIPTDRAEATAWARRLVAERCIYGVDLNGLAVELAKLSLWLVTLSKDKPFTFLDDRLKHGNSLIGASFFAETDLEIKKGKMTAQGRARQISFIPDAALEARRGATKDEKATARKRIDSNRTAQAAILAGMMDMFANVDFADVLRHLVDQTADLSKPTRSAEQYQDKADLLRHLLSEGDYPALKEIADLWCAVWFWERDIEAAGLPPTTQEYHDVIVTILGLVRGIATQETRIRQIRDTARRIAAQEYFFHWELEYPFVFARHNPGFDATVGNPPWEVVQAEPQEFFEAYDPKFRDYTKEESLKIVEKYLSDDSAVADTWFEYATRQGRQSFYFAAGVAFCYQGSGKSSTHKLFAERFFWLLREYGRIALMMPSAIYSDLGTRELRRHFLANGRIIYLLSFSNERFIFPHVHHFFRFSLLGIQKGVQSTQFLAAFRYDPRLAVTAEELPDFIENEHNLLSIPVDSITRFSPDSFSIMEFRNQEDLDVSSKIYGDLPLIGEPIPSQWDVRFGIEFQLNEYSHILQNEPHGLPLFEGKMIHQFDAFYDSPQYWIDEESGRSETIRNGVASYELYRFVYRRISNSSNERTLISSVIPKMCFTSASVPHSLPGNAEYGHLLYLISCLNSYVLDYCIRQKVSTTINTVYLYQLPLPRLTPGNPYFAALLDRSLKLSCTSQHFADLWYEVTGMVWPNDIYICPPPRTGDLEIHTIRQRLRDESDALVAHLYGLSRDDFAHILGTFPLVFPNTSEGEAKKAALLAVYDEYNEITAGWARQ
ncbi:MAG: SAM-dependent methyltransferase [Anaerolineae bacterium]|nr:SAM-dependent methyltransferase [Anaerolineae bacterium]NUQ04746.1 N-6 DNA methylase [Anaerolineae bacterium]